MTHSVLLDGHSVGTVRIEKQGLYYRFQCQCQLPKDGIFTLLANSGGHREDLGVLLPDPAGFGLVTRMPAKRFPEENITFCLLPKEGRLDTKFVPISQEDPFFDLDELENAKFAVVDKQPGIILQIKSSRPAEEHCCYP